MSRLVPFDSLNVSVTFAGISLEDGRAEDEWISLEYQNDQYVDEVGSDGIVIRSASHDDRVDIEITLKGSSLEHAKLSAIHNADRLSRNGAGVSTLVIRDSAGTSLFATSQAWVVKAPAFALGVSRADMTWTLRAVIGPDAIFGGN